MLKLLNAPVSVCSQKVRLALYEKELPFENTEVNLRDREHLAPAYLALNPNGVVPTLLHDDVAIIDSSVILEYLEEVFPEVQLGESTPAGRAALRAWLRFLEEMPTAAVRVPTFAHALGRPLKALSAEQVRANADARTVRRAFYREMGHGFTEEKYQEALDRLDQTLERMEKALSTHEWLMPRGFSLVDICAIPIIDRMEDLGLAGMWADRPGVTRWWAVAKQRPSYAETYVKGARLSDMMDDVNRAPFPVRAAAG